jgi:glycosyl transferase family 25
VELTSLAPLLDVVDRVVVVTIRAATDRQRRISEELQKHGLQFEFYFGLDSRAFRAEMLRRDGVYDPAQRLAEGRAELTAGEIGCAVSHRDVARNFLETSDRRILVLEDDAAIVSSQVTALPRTIRKMPRDWNLAYFAYEMMNLHTPRRLRVKLLTYYPLRKMLGLPNEGLSVLRRTYRRRLNSHWLHAGCFHGGQAYALDRTAAEFVVRTQTPIAFESDVALCRLVKFAPMKSICVRHPLFEQLPDTPSIIGARPWWSNFKKEEPLSDVP